MKTRSLNVELIDMTILQRGWNRERAALECKIAPETLNRIYRDENVRNAVILRLSTGLDIPLTELVVWRENGHAVQTSKDILDTGREIPPVNQDQESETRETKARGVRTSKIPAGTRAHLTEGDRRLSRVRKTVQ